MSYYVCKEKNQILERASSKLNNLQLQEQSIEEQYGYGPNPTYSTGNQVEVNFHNKKLNLENTSLDMPKTSIFSDVGCNFIKPIPTQTLTVQDAAGNNIHMDLDTGATVSYVKLDAVKRHNFKIKPNLQLSNLADGKTKMASMGEIDEYFYRNNWKVHFHAIIAKDLHCDFVAGNNFFLENKVTQDIDNRTITIHKRYTIPETNKTLILPTVMSNLILKNNNIKVVLPGNAVPYQVPHQNGQTLAVQPCFQNKTDIWPKPQLCKVSNGFINVINNSDDILSLKNGNNKIQIRTLDDPIISEPKCFATYPAQVLQANDRHKNIQINSDGVDSNVIDFIKDTNEKYKDVFNDDLSKGYNMNYGKHVCNLNWASEARPPANKVHNINYDHDTKVLLQQVCDEFTQAGVLGIPQDFNVQVQHVSPCFLVRKQRAKNKNKNELTPKDVRLVVNFGKLNDHLKNIPTPVTKSKDIFTHLGRWKHIIVMDLFQGFFQNHMAANDGQWLGISTPFGGLRFMRRSGQGLLGQCEELDELLTKVLSIEIQSGYVTRIADDLYIGGATPMETAKNYEQVIAKLNAANLKISADKTKIFLDSVDILGWVWKKGGFVSPSPHRINSLKNTVHTDITCVKDLRSWLGLYKTLMPASPNLTLILDPFDKVVADKDSKDIVDWDESLKMHFTKAKEAVDNIQTLYLPDPNDQLLIVVDAAKAKPGLGHILYAIKDNTKLPVSFHSNKLSENHAKWHSCELEALAFATAVTAEYHVLKESKKPILIAPDSKAVADAVNLIKKGNHSSNPRIQALITNVNRIPLIVQLANGKNKLNACGDHQSRFPSPCTVEHCVICNFVQESTDIVLSPYAINAAKPDDIPAILDNKAAWKKVQEESKSCQQAVFNLTSGKTPTKQSGKSHSEVRRLSSVANINKEGMLVVMSRPHPFSSTRHEQLVIPSSHLPAVLWQMHNVFHHPSKSQLKSQFEKSFYSVGLHPELDKIYQECHFCVTQMKIPPVVPHYTKDDSRVPGTNFHADVIKRRTQCILTIRDNFSSFTVARIIKSEGHKDLKEGIIDLLTPIKLAGTINVKVDNATGFLPLLNNKDPDLNKLFINIIATDVFNRNENAVVDKACYELEQELIRLEPDGRQVSNTTIQIAVQSLNKKLRRNGKISAYEIYFNRDISTGNNLNLNYETIKDKQVENRNMHNQRHNSKIKIDPTPCPEPGDIVISKTQKNDKHKARDMFFVKSTTENNVEIQKIIHSMTNKSNIRQKSYITSKDRVIVTKQTHTDKSSSTVKQRQTSWHPTRPESEYSSDEENYQVPPISITPFKKSVETNDSNSDITQQQEHILTTPRRPALYQELDQWMFDQRQQAAQQLTVANTPERTNVFQTPPVTPTVPVIDKRAEMKARAKEKISACYGKNIPQIDGAISTTNSSASNSCDPSPDTSPEHVQPSVQQRFNKQTQPCGVTGFIWDYFELDTLYQSSLDPDVIFGEPTVEMDFLRRHGSAHF